MSRMVEYDYLIARAKEHPFTRNIVEFFKSLKTVDAVEVVRCKNCKHSIDYYNDSGCYCRKPNADNGLDYIFGGWDWFCADGERKEASE